MFPRQEIKRDQKLNMKNREGEYLTVTLVYLALITTLSLLSQFSSVGANLLGAFTGTYAFPVLPMGILNLAITILVIPVFQQGYRYYTRKLADERPGSVQDLFAPFIDSRRIVKLQLWTILFTFLWSLLFIIPGFIALYRYRFAYYILMDHPDITAKEALAYSTDLTKGYKWDLFVLDLSFLGWTMLTSLTFGILGLWISPYQLRVEAEAYKYISFQKGAF